MIWELIAVVFAGLGAAGIALTLRMLSRKRLPKWIIPALAGIGMIAAKIYMEYTALDQVRARLPQGTEVLSVKTDVMAWRPWTYLKPLEVGFTALDTGSVQRRQLETGERLVRFVLYRFEKTHVTQATPEPGLLNCDSRERVTLDEKGLTPIGEVQLLEAGDPLLQRLCNG